MDEILVLLADDAVFASKIDHEGDYVFVEAASFADDVK
jgi:hypothetical protein